MADDGHAAVRLVGGDVALQLRNLHQLRAARAGGGDTGGEGEQAAPTEGQGVLGGWQEGCVFPLPMPAQHARSVLAQRAVHAGGATGLGRCQGQSSSRAEGLGSEDATIVHSMNRRRHREGA